MALAWQPFPRSEVDDLAYEGDPVDIFVAVAELLERPRWHHLAACRGHENPHLWFPTQGEDLRPARSICDACPVQRQCLDAGLSENVGVWGGASPAQRRKLRHTAA